jgi:hypothetical protein
MSVRGTSQGQLAPPSSVYTQQTGTFVARQYQAKHQQVPDVAHGPCAPLPAERAALRPSDRPAAHPRRVLIYFRVRDPSAGWLQPSRRAGREKQGGRESAEGAPPGDKEPRRATAATRGRGFIGADEGSKVMRNSEESRAGALVKNRGQRVTVVGGEARDAGHPKRTRNAAAAAPPPLRQRPTTVCFSYFSLFLWVCAS